MSDVSDAEHCPPHPYQDSIRSMLVEYKFHAADRGVYTTARDLYEAWLPYARKYVLAHDLGGDAEHAKSGEALYESFRAALGRVVRFGFREAGPDQARTLAALSKVQKRGTMYAFASERVRRTTLWADRRRAMTERGRDREKRNRADPGIMALQEHRKQVRLQHVEDESSDAKAQRHTTWRYVTEFVSDLKCAPVLLELGLYPDGKEMSESMGTFAAARSHLFKLRAADAPDAIALSSDDPRVTAVFVGDGSTPRTGALFAFRTSWRCISVDPQMRVDSTPWGAGHIERLEVHRAKIEELEFNLEGPVLVVLFHAHVSIAAVERSVAARGGMAMIACPCCNFHDQQACLSGRPPDVEFEDDGIPSGRRTIRVWKCRQGRRPAEAT